MMVRPKVRYRRILHFILGIGVYVLVESTVIQKLLFVHLNYFVCVMPLPQLPPFQSCLCVGLCGMHRGNSFRSSTLLVTMHASIDAVRGYCEDKHIGSMAHTVFIQFVATAC